MNEYNMEKYLSIHSFSFYGAKHFGKRTCCPKITIIADLHKIGLENNDGMTFHRT